MWIPPQVGWYRVNTDGSSSSTRNLASCGGIIRDHHGNYVAGFSVKLGSCSIAMTELWGAYIYWAQASFQSS